MTPEDIRSQRFTTRLLHGLSPEEVSAFLEDVAEAFGNIQHAHASLIERVSLSWEGNPSFIMTSISLR
jgi:DivIVA domain-containing protein